MNNNDQKLIQNTLDHRLSGLQGDPFLAQQVIAAEKRKESKMKKKASVTLVFALIATLLAATALAAGLLFSARYDAAKLANQALHDKYGITDKMITVFCRESEQDKNGGTTFTYQSIENIARMGVYTVTVKDGKAEAMWSLDGVDTKGGLEAKAWGAEQVEMMLKDYPAVMTYLGSQPDAYTQKPIPTPPPATEEEQLIANAKIKIQVLEAAKITLDEARESARLAIVKEHGLTSGQEQCLFEYEGEEYFQMEDGQPMFIKFFTLSQGEKWTEKDGIYVVTVNLRTGEIEGITYDSGLAGNG